MLLTSDPYADARMFLSRVLPWPPLGTDAWVNIHWTHQKPGYNNPAFRGAPCKDVTQCVNAITKNVNKPGNKDFYVCLSTQRETTVMQHANGQFPVALRNIDNAVQLRSLWIDLDVEAGNKSGKCYQNAAEALQALAVFIKHSGMPRPNVVVESGSGGYHLYWTLNGALTYDQWRPMAVALAEATRRHQLNCDAGCTVDGARVLRIPGTLNRKHNPPRPVRMVSLLPHDYDVDDIRQRLTPYMGAQVIPLHTSGGNNAVAQANSELSGGLETPKAPPVSLDTIAQAGCGFVKDAIDTGGKQFANPLWNLSTLLATFTEGGRADAHRMAAGHATYSAPETDALFDRKESERASRGLGWPSCDAIENAGCRSCATCTIRQPGSKPIQFGRPTQAPAPPTPQAGVAGVLPPGYFYKSDLVYRVELLKDGSPREVMVAAYPMLKPWIQKEPWTLHFDTRIGGVKTMISIPGEVTSSSDLFAKVLTRQGMMLAGPQYKEMREFVMAWMRKLQEVKDAIVTAAPFGWIYDRNGKLEGFAYSGTVFMGKGEMRPAAQPGTVLRDQYTPQGELSKWAKAANMVTSLGSPERDAYIAAAFAGPLVHFTGQEGLLISTYSSESGHFKTTALRVAQAVWGEPIQASQGLTDTQNSVINKIGTLKHLPVFWDELKTENDTQRFVALAFQLAGGREKARMGADTQLRPITTWETLMVSASNDSILDQVARHTVGTTAGVHRVFEFVIPVARSRITASEADQIMLDLRRNFGNAGLVYARYLGENHERIRAEIANMKQNIESKLGITKEERFWASTMAVLICGAVYANSLGLTKIDAGALIKFLNDSLRRMRERVNTSGTDMRETTNVASVFQEFVGAMANRIVVTDKVWTQKGRPPPNSCKLLNAVDLSRMQGVAVHIAVETKLMRVSKAAFVRWCEQHKYSPSVMVGSLEKKFHMRTMNGKIGSGLGLPGSPEWLLEFDLSHPDLSHFVNLD
jgi:hypothetical protein